MPKYEVRIWEVYRTDMVIEADNETEALKIGRGRVENGEGPDEWVMEKDTEVVLIKETKGDILCKLAVEQGLPIVTIKASHREPNDYMGIPYWEGEGLLIDEINAEAGEQYQEETAEDQYNTEWDWISGR